MKKIVFLFLLVFPLALFAQEGGSFQDEYAGVMQFTAGKISSLAEAIPADKYTWSPSEGVRSVAGVLGHMTGANYFFSNMLGTPVPEGIDPRSFDNNDTPKEEAIANLNASFDHAMKAVSAVSNDAMSDMVPFPDGNKYSKRTIMFILMSHFSEHMGQMIAYARSNDIAPPWSTQGGGEED